MENFHIQFNVHLRLNLLICLDIFFLFPPVSKAASIDAFLPAEDEQVVRMKEENLFHRRFSLCPNATSPPKIDPPTLTRNLSYGGDNDLCNLSPGES